MFGSGYSAGPGQIVPRGYSTGPGQIDPRLFSRTRLNSYNVYRLFKRTENFYAKVFKKFLFVFLYLIMCIVFKSVYIDFFLFVLDSFFSRITKYGEERPMCMCKDMDHMLIMVCLAGH